MSGRKDEQDESSAGPEHPPRAPAAAPWERDARQFQAVLDAVPAPIWFKDAAGIYQGCNAAFEAYLGLPRERIVGQPVEGVAPPDLAAVYRAADAALIATGGTQAYETEVAYADGSRRRVILRKSVFRGEAGQVAGLAGCMEDVTAQRRAEAAQAVALGRAARTEESFRALVEASPDLVLIHRDARALYANPALLRVLGVDAARVEGVPLLQFVHPEDRPAVAPRLLEDGIRGGLTPPQEVRLLAAGGGVVHAEFIGLGLDFDGRPARVAIGRDLTERHQAQARLAMADRLASIGTLAAGVAHELNNPLTFVLSNLSFAAEELHRLLARQGAVAAEAGEDLERALEEARQGADRMRVIVRDLKALSRGDEAAHGPVEVSKVVEYAAGLAWTQVRHRARLVRDVAGAPAVLGSEARLGQVLLNLLVNAAHAIPEGAPERHEIRVSARRTADGRVAIEVRDTGAGMTPEVRAKIFDPFFTTKSPGVGTGLGLWVCHNLVAAHGGEMEVESEPGRGSTFRILLPAAPVAATAPVPVAPAHRPAAPRARLLVVDDEPFVGATLRRQLAGGYDVEVVASGDEALRRLSAGKPYDAVICDVVMPGTDGVALRAEIAQRTPGLADRMLFITGGAATPAAARLLQSGVTWLEKPFDRRDLLSALQRVLDKVPKA